MSDEKMSEHERRRVGLDGWGSRPQFVKIDGVLYHPSLNKHEQRIGQSYVTDCDTGHRWSTFTGVGVKGIWDTCPICPPPPKPLSEVEQLRAEVARLTEALANSERERLLMLEGAGNRNELWEWYSVELDKAGIPRHEGVGALSIGERVVRLREERDCQEQQAYALHNALSWVIAWLKPEADVVGSEAHDLLLKLERVGDDVAAAAAAYADRVRAEERERIAAELTATAEASWAAADDLDDRYGQSSPGGEMHRTRARAMRDWATRLREQS